MEKTIKLLNEKRGRARIAYLLHSLILLTIVVMIFQGHYPLAMGLAAMALLLYIAMVRRATREFNESFTEQNTRLNLSRHLQNIRYEAKPGSMLGILQQDGLLPLMERGLLVYHLVSGERDGMQVSIMDATTPVPDNAGRGQAKFLSGAWVRMVYHDARFSGKARAYSEDLYIDYDLDSFASGIFQGTPRKNAEPAGNQHILWLWEQEAENLYHAARQAVSELACYTTGDIAVAVNENACSVFIQRRFLAAPGVSLKKPVTAEMLGSDHFPELNRVLEVGRALLQAGCSDALTAS